MVMSHGHCTAGKVLPGQVKEASFTTKEVLPRHVTTLEWTAPASLLKLGNLND